MLGGDTGAIAERLEESYADAMPAADGVKAAAQALAGPDRTLEASDLEVAILDRESVGRAFRRWSDEEVSAAIS